ncbi:hypothetical protein G6F59_015300 [Rhizopus arrhizus]|nr:hypothetical protein G6F59_015300 [Rhizopus arrhizus]
MSLGMLPTALSTEQNAPLGRAVIGGLLLATCATLLFVPVVFALAHSPFAAPSSGPGRRRGGHPRCRWPGPARAAGTRRGRVDRAPGGAVGAGGHRRGAGCCGNDDTAVAPDRGAPTSASR